MRFEDEIELYLADEMDPDARAAFEARLDADVRAARHVELERRLRTRLAGQNAQDTLGAPKREAIWSRFHEAAEEDTVPLAPVHPGPGSSGFPWKVLAAPVAAGLIALVAWSAGFFDSDPNRTQDSDRNGLQAELVDPGPTIRQQAPVIQAVFAADRRFRRDRQDGETKVQYADRLRNALDGKSMVSVWFDQKKVASRSARLGEIERIISECTRGPVNLPALPEKATIEACCIHEFTLEGNPVRIPHVMLSCEGRKLSAYFLCGSLRPAVEAAMKRCEKLTDVRLDEGSATKIHQCPECGVFALPRGNHLLVLVSDLDPKIMGEVVELF